MSRRLGRPQRGPQRFVRRVSSRVTEKTGQRGDAFLAKNPNMNWSDLIEKSINFYLDRQEQGTDLAIRLDVLKSEIIEARNDIQKHMELHLHHIKNDFCFHPEKLTIEQITRGERRYNGFIRALNKRLKTELYSTEIYDATKDVDVRKAAKALEQGKEPVEATNGNGDAEARESGSAAADGDRQRRGGPAGKDQRRL